MLPLNKQKTAFKIKNTNIIHYHLKNHIPIYTYKKIHHTFHSLPYPKLKKPKKISKKLLIY